MTGNCRYSFWELQSFSHYDYVIIGAGITGLSTAVSIREKHPHSSILVLEKGFLPTGASTKNAGFSCFGSATEIYDDLQIMSPGKVFELVQMRWEGLQILRNRLGDKAIDFKQYGGYELIGKDEEYILPELEQINALIEPLFKTKVFNLEDEKIKYFGFGNTKHLIKNVFEGQIDTGKMMRALIRYALTTAIEIKTGVEVRQIQDNNSNVSVILKNESFEIKARKLVVCTNAFTENLLPSLDIYPGRGQVLITKAVKGLPFKGVFHFDKGYYYFRNFGDRIIFGGGRNRFFEQETTTDISCEDNVISHLKHLLSTKIIPGKKIEIEHIWSGIMAFGSSKKPIVKQYSKNVYAAVRLGGMGVAIGSLLGQKVVDEFDL